MSETRHRSEQGSNSGDAKAEDPGAKALGRYKSAESRDRALSKLLPPWKPGQSGNPAGRVKSRTFEEEARAILDQGVLPKLRETVAMKTGLPLCQVDQLSMRQASILLLLVDMVAKGKTDALDRIIDRTDPKSRRIEHTGQVNHELRAAAKALGMSEADAAEVYRGMLDTGEVLDVEPIEPSEDAASD